MRECWLHCYQPGSVIIYSLWLIELWKYTNADEMSLGRNETMETWNNPSSWSRSARTIHQWFIYLDSSRLNSRHYFLFSFSFNLDNFYELSHKQLQKIQKCNELRKMITVSVLLSLILMLLSSRERPIQHCVKFISLWHFVSGKNAQVALGCVFRLYRHLGETELTTWHARHKIKMKRNMDCLKVAPASSQIKSGFQSSSHCLSCRSNCFTGGRCFSIEVKFQPLPLPQITTKQCNFLLNAFMSALDFYASILTHHKRSLTEYHSSYWYNRVTC